ncbi:MAG TPA: RiPP maturation radical SAM C-methyltransferase [Methanothrix sp.]|nr:RiPP maturation radical SAM C-methyltransferase [Methanothrix sp.]
MIHLVNMPFASLTAPNLALGLIKAQLREEGLESKVVNLNFDFARMIGFGGYERVALFKGVETQVGEWLFAKEAWGPFGPSEEEFVERCEGELKTIPKVPEMKGWLLKIRREVVPMYLLQSLRRLEREGEPVVVAFSCSFFQTSSALALGRLIKEVHPDVKLAYGGACFHDQMGLELLEKAPWIDAVSTGEADDVIVPLFRKLLDGEAPSDLQGIVYRDDGVVRSGPVGRPASSEVLEGLPDPDYDDFFDDSKRIGISEDPGWKLRVRLFFESSRGCWWGEKRHCSFCGLNGKGLSYRSKSADRVIGTLKSFANLYPVSTYQASDNNISPEYFETFLPRIRDDPPKRGARLFYEVKTDLTRPQIKTLADAGVVYLQPGIESLSTHLLHLMRKGTTAIQNLFFLKCCRTYGILVLWNNLIRIPGEGREDYREMEVLIPKIHHFNPPSGGAKKVECHRFSPYFTGEVEGADNLRPLSWYSALYPEDRIDLRRVAYYFDADWTNVLDDEARFGVTAKTQEWLRIWQNEADLPALRFLGQVDGEAVVLDSRAGGRRELWLDPIEAGVLRAIDDPASIDAVCRHLGEEATSRGAIEDILQGFVEAGMAYQERGKYLGLALPGEVNDPPLSSRRGYYPPEY